MIPLDLVIETPRLRLRLPTYGDLPACHALTASEEMRRYLSFSASEADSLNRMLRQAGGWFLFGYGVFVVERRDDGRFVGNVGPFRAGRGKGEDFDPLPELGWIIAADQHGQGFAREAAQASIAWLFATRGIQPVVCMINEGNVPSERLAASLDFRPMRRVEEEDGTVLNLYRREAAPIEDNRL